MIRFDGISSFDPVSAAGILARASMHLDDDANPAGEGRVAGEAEIRDRIMRQLRAFLGVRESDTSEHTRALLVDALDEAAEELLSPTDEQATLASLSNKGELPSDLYLVVLDSAVQEYLGSHFESESILVRQTVQSPDREQHFNAGADGEQGATDVKNTLISLFSRFFLSKFPARSFTLLVTGQRYGMTMRVVQALRIYSDVVDLNGTKDLLDMLQRFTNRFGTDVAINDSKPSAFLVSEHTPDADNKLSWDFAIQKSEAKGDRIWVSQFGGRLPGQNAFKAITTAINLDKYLRFVGSRGWEIR